MKLFKTLTKQKFTHSDKHSKKSWGLTIARAEGVVQQNVTPVAGILYCILSFLQAAQEGCFLTSKPEKSGGREVFLKGTILEEKPQVHLAYQHLSLLGSLHQVISRSPPEATNKAIISSSLILGKLGETDTDHPTSHTRKRALDFSCWTLAESRTLFLTLSGLLTTHAPK